MSQHRLRRGGSHPSHRRSQTTHVFKRDTTLGVWWSVERRTIFSTYFTIGLVISVILMSIYRVFTRQRQLRHLADAAQYFEEHKPVDD